jgi:uncharacterized protein (TIGR02246 family)
MRKGLSAVTIAALESIRPVLDRLEDAWDNGDGMDFAAACSADVDFIDLLGMYVQGRAAVAALHEKILHGPYTGSTLRLSVERVRVLSDATIVAIVPGELRIPAGPVAGLVLTVATMLFERRGTGWELASFHATKRESTHPDHTAVMLDLFASERL